MSVEVVTPEEYMGEVIGDLNSRRGHISSMTQRQEAQVARFQDLEKKLLPQNMGYSELPVISRQAAEKLDRVKPRSLGQASRIPGMPPAAVSLLMVHLKKTRKQVA